MQIEENYYDRETNFISTLLWPIPDPVKWLIIALSSFGLVMGIYEFLVRRFNLMRFLFGMKPMTKQPDVRMYRPVLTQ